MECDKFDLADKAVQNSRPMAVCYQPYSFIALLEALMSLFDTRCPKNASWAGGKGLASVKVNTHTHTYTQRCIWTYTLLFYHTLRETKPPLSLPSVHLIGHVAGGEGPWGHTALSERPLLAQLSPAPHGVAWEVGYTCHWDSLIRSSRPAPDPSDTTWESRLIPTCSPRIPCGELTARTRSLSHSLPLIDIPHGRDLIHGCNVVTILTYWVPRFN